MNDSESGDDAPAPGPPAHPDAADTAPDDSDLGRIWWRSRRGLRELDLLLLPFVEDVVPVLDAGGRADYLRLIDREDTELMALLTGREPLDDPALVALVERIRGKRRIVS